MSLPYVPGDIIAEAIDRRRQGESIASLAGKIGISPEDLGALLGEPAWKPIPAKTDSASGTDLWRDTESVL